MKITASSSSESLVNMYRLLKKFGLILWNPKVYFMFTVSPLHPPLDPVQSTLPHTFSIVYDIRDSNMKDAKLQSNAFVMFVRLF